MTAALGLLTVAWPLAWAPAWAYVTASLGAAAVLAAAILRWRRGPGLAVAAAIVSCAFSDAGVAVLVAEGLFILGYLLVADAPQGLTVPVRWLRRQAVLLVAGLIATGAVLAAYAVRPADSVWLVFAGLAAVVAAYLIALPSWWRGR
jgi:hypothetical protein